MDDDTRSYYERKSKQYREELKTWEHAWLKDQGKKPSRSDIKNNPEIASKYKLFQKAQDILSGKTAPPPKEPSRQHKRKSSEAPIPSETPLKQAKHTETPSNTRFQDQSAEETPTISRKLFTPSANSSLGPTPQRDGRVLGLFDLLEDSVTAATPSRKQNEVAGTPSRNQATPSKPSSTLDVEVTPRLGRTPMSDSKRQYLNTFMSPLKNRDSNIGTQTPSKLHFETPKFLRRHTLPTVDENGDFDKPAPLRLPRKPLGRGLSEIVASLRKDEEDKADEDLDALREVEAEELGRPIPKATLKENVEVKDSQLPQLPLGGFDDEAAYDSDPEEQKGADGQPLRIFKKKGQKRTTRRVNIKPTWHKRPATSTEEKDDSENEDGVVPKTQLQDDAYAEGENDVSSASEAEDKKKTSAKKRKKDANDKKEGPVKKAARKVNELAHANFQKLKLRQNGAKGGPGYNSRFRRRR